MKQKGFLLLGVFCMAASLFAQESGKAQEMSGTICNFACVQPVNNLLTCNTSCNDNSGDTVLVDDQGKVMKISNPKMAASHMNTHVSLMAVPTEKEREELIRVLQFTN